MFVFHPSQLKDFNAFSKILKQQMYTSKDTCKIATMKQFGKKFMNERNLHCVKEFKPQKMNIMN